MKRRRIAAVSLGILLLTAGGIFFAVKRADVHYGAERRLWKNQAIVAITNDLKDPDYLTKRFGEIPKPRSEWDTSETGWLTGDTIVCRDGTWLAYRSRCHKQDPKIHDIFIAKASDKNWYYSDFHFCVDAMVLAMYGQPDSLEGFKKKYYLVRFDGTSDDALKPTWNPKLN